MDGTKTIEIRKYSNSTHGMSKVMYIIQTKGSPRDVTEVSGLVEFYEEETIYSARDDLIRDAGEHRIVDMDILCDASGTHWNFKKPLYGWHVRNRIMFERPLPCDVPGMPKRSTLGWLKPVSLKVTVSEDDVDVIQAIKRRRKC